MNFEDYLLYSLYFILYTLNLKKNKKIGDRGLFGFLCLPTLYLEMSIQHLAAGAAVIFLLKFFGSLFSAMPSLCKVNFSY